jgi:hypothetical protein
MRTTITFTLDFEIQNLKKVSVLSERDINTPGFELGLSTNSQWSYCFSLRLDPTNSLIRKQTKDTVVIAKFLKGISKGPVNIDNIWRIRNNVESDKLTEGADIVRFIKAQRIKWLGHIQRMDQARPARNLLDWKPMGTRPVGRQRQRW